MNFGKIKVVTEQNKNYFWSFSEGLVNIERFDLCLTGRRNSYVSMDLPKTPVTICIT